MTFLCSLKKLLLAISCFAISFIPITILAAFICLFRGLRWIFGIFLTIIHRKKITFVDGLDAIHLRRFDDPQITTGVRLHICGICNIQLIQERFANLLTEVNENNQLVAERFKVGLRKRLGYCYWLPIDDIRIEDHVKLWEGDKPKTNDDLHRLLARLYTEGTKYTEKPLWKSHVIQLEDNFPGLKGPNYIIFLCFHHALTDGISISRIIMKYLSDENIPYEQRHSGLKKTSKIIEIFYLTLKILYTPLAMLKFFKGMKDSNCLTGPYLNGTKIIAFSRLVALDRVKRIKNLTSTTVNDVVMSCITAGLRNYCLSKNDDLSQTVLRCAMPIAFHDLSLPMYLYNNCTFVVYEFPLNEDDVMGRLMATKSRMNELKSDASIFGVYYFAKYCYNTFPLFIYYLLAWRNHVSAVVSNTPGPQTTFKALNGDEVFNTSAVISNSVPKTGLSFSITTFNNVLQFGINVDAAIISKQEIAQRIVDDCVNEIKNLEKLIINK